MSSPLISPRFQFPCATPGAAAAGFKLNTYVAGTNTPLATYTNSTLSVANANPVIMGADGCADVWLGQQAYKLVGTDAANNVLWTEDGVTQASVGNAQNEWVPSGLVPTYLTTSTFSLAGVADLTIAPYSWVLGTRLRVIDNSSVVVYVTVSSIAGNVVTITSAGLSGNPLNNGSVAAGLIVGPQSSIFRRSLVSVIQGSLTNLTNGVLTQLTLTGGPTQGQVDQLAEFTTVFTPRLSGVYRITGVVAINEFIGTLTVLSSAWTVAPTKNGAYLDSQQFTWPIANNIAASMLVPYDITATLVAGDTVGVACTSSFTGTQMTASVRSFNVERIS